MYGNPLNNIEHALRNWRWGPTNAEQACAAFLIRSGYLGVVSQAPYGGGDGGKDIRFNAPEGVGTAACYFPHSGVTFRDISEKYQGDLTKALKNGANRFLFITGQHLTVGQRSLLISGSSIPCDVVDYDTLVTQYDVFAPYMGEPAADIQQKAQRANDVLVIREVFRITQFFALPGAVDLAPKSFGGEILEMDHLRELAVSGRVFFSDEQLRNRYDAWVIAWDALLLGMRPYYHFVSGRLYKPGSQYLGLPPPSPADDAEDQRVRAEIDALANAFLIAHRSLLVYVQQFYPEALQWPAAA